MTVRGANQTSTADASECFSSFQLERYVTGELDATQARRVEAHLAACAACRKQVEDLEKARAEFLSRMPFDTFYRDLEQRLAREALEAHDGRQRGAASGIEALNRWWHRTWGRLVDVVRGLSGPQWALAAVAVVALIVVAPSISRLANSDHSDVRTKASEQAPGPLDVILLRDGRISQPRSGDVFHAGDRLQFRVTPGGWRYLHLVSLDDQGRLTPFFPDDGSPSMKLLPDAEQLLPDAVMLDDFVGQERIFAVFTRTPLDYAALEEAVRTLVENATLPLDLEHITALPIDGTAQVSFLMIKE